MVGLHLLASFIVLLSSTTFLLQGVKANCYDCETSLGQDTLLSSSDTVHQVSNDHKLPVEAIQPFQRRVKRYSTLSLPANTSCRVLLNVIVPVKPSLNNTFTSLIITLPFRFVLPTYKYIQNIIGRSEIDLDHSNDDDVDERARKRSEEYHHQSIYEHVEDLFNRFGFSGTSCLKRAICELAQTPLDGHHGLLGRLVNLLFMPAIQWNRKAAADVDGDEYYEAYRAGKKGQCRSAKYDVDCPISLIKPLEL